MRVAKLRFVGTLMFSNHRNGATWKMWSMPSVAIVRVVVENAGCRKCGERKMPSV